MTDSQNARELILGILLDVTRDNEYSHIAISNVLNKYQYLEKQERAFISRVAEGTIEHMIELDYIINQFSNTKVNKMKPVIRCILRSGVYELKYMDSVPASATCNEAVKLAKKKGFKNLTGFVNGVLRNISRGLDEVTYPDKRMEFVSYMSVKYSVPEWIIQLWLKSYKAAQIEEMLASFVEPSPLTIRTNRNRLTPEELLAKLTAEGITATVDDEISYAFHIEGIDYLGALASFREGDFYVQDISSMKVAETAHPKEGDLVIDVCAAPGGKSIHVAELLHGTGRVIARDLTDYKVQLIQDNIDRCQMTNMQAQQWDATVYDESCEKQADIVIADLPCSGLGVMGKKADIRYKMTPEKLESLAALQREILTVVHNYVKPGGTLVYSTCTIDRAENEDNVAWFLSEYPEYELISEEQILPQSKNNDGFFIAKLQRNRV